MSDAVALSFRRVPLAATVYTWLLFVVLSLCFFSHMMPGKSGLTFPGTSITYYYSQLGFANTGVGALCSIAGIFVASLLNSPRLLALVLVTRLVIEIGNLVVNLDTGGTISNNILVGVIAALDLLAILTLMQVIRHSRGPA